MSVFHYQAYNAEGRAIQGSLEAENLSSLESRLRGLGLWLISTKTSHADSIAVGTGGSRLRVGRSELIQFFIQMSLLLRADITLPNALERLAADTRGRKMGVVLISIHEQILVGTPLHTAMSLHPRVFGRQVIAMIEAGEISGKLPEVFENLSSYLEWVDQLTADIRQALIYPAMVLTASLGLVTLLFTVVVPRFVGLLTDLNLEVPLLTRGVMACSALLLQGWPVWLALGIGLPLLFRFGMKQASFAVKCHRVFMTVPLFGELFAMFGFSRFAQNLAMLCRAGIPLLKGLEICQPLTGNHAIEAAIGDTRRLVTEGTPLHRALGEQALFPPTLLTMIATGESSGNLDFSLKSAADYYNKIIPRRIKMIFSIFDPAMMITLIAVVGTVALSVMLPILSLWEAQ